MRRFARLGLTILPLGLLPGCSGFGHFLGDNFGLQANHNAPHGDSENIRRARGEEVAVPALLPAPGDVWPGPPPPEPTLSDLQREQNAATPQSMEPGPAGAMPQRAPNAALPPPGAIPDTTPLPRPAAPQTAAPKTFVTPGGPLRGTPVPDGSYQTLTGPKGGSAGIAIPNGNGTTTIIAPDGSVSTVPTPK